MKNWPGWKVKQYLTPNSNCKYLIGASSGSPLARKIRMPRRSPYAKIHPNNDNNKNNNNHPDSNAEVERAASLGASNSLESIVCW